MAETRGKTEEQPKRRGRKPKTEAAVEAVPAAEPAEPKKRGRKPKTEAAVEAVPAAEPAEPKKRGRKPKATVETAEAVPAVERKTARAVRKKAKADPATAPAAEAERNLPWEMAEAGNAAGADLVREKAEAVAEARDRQIRDALAATDPEAVTSETLETEDGEVTVRKIRSGSGKVDPSRMPGFAGYVLRKGGKYLSAVAYGGPGKPVPYWTDELRGVESVKIWKKLDAARGALVKFGGTLRAVRWHPRTGVLCRIWGWSEELEGAPEEEE